MSVRRLAIVFGLVAAVGRPAAAQQNLFNVPNSEITAANSLFFQQQFNFTRSGQSNTTVSYGLGKNWEVGINLLDQPFYAARPAADGISDSQVNPDFLFNAQKGFELTKQWKIGVGTQVGVNPSPDVKAQRLLNYTYINNVFQFPEDRGQVIVGGYFANHAYLGDGNRFGFQAGVDIPLIKDKLNFQADYISGNSDISVGVVGFVVMLPRDWQISFGAQFPAPRSRNQWGGVIELTWIPKSKDDKKDGKGKKDGDDDDKKDDDKKDEDKKDKENGKKDDAGQAAGRPGLRPAGYGPLPAVPGSR